MLALYDYLPYLLNRAGARLAGAFAEVARRYEITLPMWRVLAVLSEEQRLSMGRLAEITTIEFSTLSRVIDGMVTRGLVARRRDTEDARRVEISRTLAGVALTEKIVPIALHFEAVAAKGLSARETRELKRLLVKVYRNLDALEAGERRRTR